MVVTDPLVTHVFQTPRGWSSGHLQTVRSRVVRNSIDLARYGRQRIIRVELADDTGDRLAVHLHRSPLLPVGESGGGLVALVHGLGGSAESAYVRATTVGLLSAGFNVARIDLRGAGLSAATSSLLYHAGRTEDIRQVLAALAREPEAKESADGTSRLALMGFSLGGNMTIKLMGEPHPDIPLFAAVAVSAPLDLTVGSEFLRTQGFGVYEKFLLAGLKRQAGRPGLDGKTNLSVGEAREVSRARSLATFDDALTAPRNGWRDAAEYYAVNSSGLFLHNITTPTLVIHSVDDPMIPASPYRAIDWEQLADVGYVQRRITAQGGHVGFHQRDDPMPWYVGEAVTFLSRA